jgi:hypothetical protein
VNVPDEHQIAVLETTTNSLKVAAEWPVTAAEKDFPMALNASAGRLYVGCRQPPCLLSYDMRTGQMVSQSPYVGDADDVFYDANTRRIYVIGGEGLVDVFQVPPAGNELTCVSRVPTVARAHRPVCAGAADAGCRPAAQHERTGGSVVVPHNTVSRAEGFGCRIPFAEFSRVMEA